MTGKRLERQHMEWTPEEIEALRTMYAKGMTETQMASALKRTKRGVNSRLTIERIKPSKTPGPASLESFKRLGLDAIIHGNGPVEKAPGPLIVPGYVQVSVESVQQGRLPIPPSDDERLSLLLEFVAMAWREGHSITIPALGATFQKSEEPPYHA